MTGNEASVTGRGTGAFCQVCFCARGLLVARIALRAEIRRGDTDAAHRPRRVDAGKWAAGVGVAGEKSELGVHLMIRRSDTFTGSYKRCSPVGQPRSRSSGPARGPACAPAGRAAQPRAVLLLPGQTAMPLCSPVRPAGQTSALPEGVSNKSRLYLFFPARLLMCCRLNDTNRSEEERLGTPRNAPPS